MKDLNRENPSEKNPSRLSAGSLVRDNKDKINQIYITKKIFSSYFPLQDENGENNIVDKPKIYKETLKILQKHITLFDFIYYKVVENCEKKESVCVLTTNIEQFKKYYQNYKTHENKVADIFDSQIMHVQSEYNNENEDIYKIKLELNKIFFLASKMQFIQQHVLKTDSIDNLIEYMVKELEYKFTNGIYISEVQKRDKKNLPEEKANKITQQFYFIPFPQKFDKKNLPTQDFTIYETSNFVNLANFGYSNEVSFITIIDIVFTLFMKELHILKDGSESSISALLEMDRLENRQTKSFLNFHPGKMNFKLNVFLSIYNELDKPENLSFIVNTCLPYVINNEQEEIKETNLSIKNLISCILFQNKEIKNNLNIHIKEDITEFLNSATLNFKGLISAYSKFSLPQSDTQSVNTIQIFAKTFEKKMKENFAIESSYITDYLKLKNNYFNFIQKHCLIFYLHKRDFANECSNSSNSYIFDKYSINIKNEFNLTKYSESSPLKGELGLNELANRINYSFFSLIESKTKISPDDKKNRNRYETLKQFFLNENRDHKIALASLNFYSNLVDLKVCFDTLKLYAENYNRSDSRVLNNKLVFENLASITSELEELKNKLCDDDNNEFDEQKIEINLEKIWLFNYIINVQLIPSQKLPKLMHCFDEKLASNIYNSENSSSVNFEKVSNNHEHSLIVRRKNDTTSSSENFKLPNFVTFFFLVTFISGFVYFVYSLIKKREKAKKKII